MYLLVRIFKTTDCEQSLYASTLIITRKMSIKARIGSSGIKVPCWNDNNDSISRAAEWKPQTGKVVHLVMTIRMNSMNDTEQCLNAVLRFCEKCFSVMGMTVIAILMGGRSAFTIFGVFLNHCRPIFNLVYIWLHEFQRLRYIPISRKINHIIARVYLQTRGKSYTM